MYLYLRILKMAVEINFNGVGRWMIQAQMNYSQIVKFVENETVSSKHSSYEIGYALIVCGIFRVYPPRISIWKAMAKSFERVCPPTVCLHVYIVVLVFLAGKVVSVLCCEQ